MVGKIVLTYKRRRFSRSVADFRVPCDSQKDKIRDDVQISEDQKSHDPVNGILDSSCANGNDFSQSKQTKESSVLEHEKVSPDSSKPLFNEDADGKNCPQEKPSDDASECLPSVKISESDIAAEKKHSVSPPFCAVSGKESSVICIRTSDEVNCSHDQKDLSTDNSEDNSKLCEDDSSCLCCSVATKRRLSSSLITFCRRSKRKLDVNVPALAYISCESQKPDVLKNDINSTSPKVDNALLPTHERDDNARSMSPFRAKKCAETEDIQQNALDMSSKSLPNVDLNTSGIVFDAVTETQDLSSLQLSITPPGGTHELNSLTTCRDIDCNRLLVSDSDEKDFPISLEVPQCPSDSTNSKTDGNRPVLQPLLLGNSLSTGIDKGKRPVDPCPPLTNSSSKSGSFELFPSAVEPKDASSGAAFSGPRDRWLQLPVFNSFPPSSDPSSSSSLLSDGLPASSTRDQYPNTLSGVGLSRPGAASGNTGNSQWLDEELDSLWIGVRRHGRRNFESILRDPRLHFSPWRTPRDLAERWQEEQHKLICSMSSSQAPYQEVVSRSQLDSLLLSLHKNPSPEQLSMAIQRSRQQFTNTATLSSSSPWNGAGGSSELGSAAKMPRWLREAPAPFPAPGGGQGAPVPHYGPWLVHQANFFARAAPYPWLNTRYNMYAPPSNNAGDLRNGRRGTLVHSPVVAPRKAEPDEYNVQDDMIMDRSDASSEETVSDDHSTRPC